MTTETTEAKILSREEFANTVHDYGSQCQEGGEKQGNGDYDLAPVNFRAAQQDKYAILAAYDALLAERDDLQIENDGISAANRSLIDRVYDLEAENVDLRNRIRDEEAMRNIDEAFAYRPIHEAVAAVHAWLESAARHVRVALADPDVSAVVAVLTAASFAASLAAGWIARRK